MGSWTYKILVRSTLAAHPVVVTVVTIVTVVIKVKKITQPL